MLKWVLAGVAVMIACTLAVASAHFIVTPDRVGVVVRGGEPVRVEPPGLRWRIPWVEDVAYLATQRLHRQQPEITVLLADGSDCRISATIETRVTDPMRAYRWRTSRGLRGGDADASAEASEYTAAATAFAAALRGAARGMTPETAADGAIKTWISKFNAETLDDGTGIVATNADAATCWNAGSQKPSVAASVHSELRYGPLKRFARSAVRPVGPEASSQDVIELRPDISIVRSGRRLQTEGLLVRVRVTDASRVQDRFGSGPAGIRAAMSRVESYLAADLRRAISEHDEASLQAFDPFILAQPGAAVAGELADEGLAVDDIGGDVMGYRLALP